MAGTFVTRIIGDDTRLGVTSVADGTACVGGRFGDAVDGDDVATGLKVVLVLGLKNEGRAIGLAIGWDVVELENRLIMLDGAQDGCVLFVSKHRHVGTVRPLLSAL